MKIVFVGAGNLATQLGKAFKRTTHEVVQVYSRTQHSAAELASLLKCTYTTSLQEVTTEADLYVIAVKDAVMCEVIRQVCPHRSDKVFLHTAGSMPLSVFNTYAKHYGVFYPLQTFSKQKDLDFKQIPCFIEANDAIAKEVICNVANILSNTVYELSSAQRKYLHLAAVYACNFTNHLYDLSSEILSRNHIPFNVMLPLIDETTKKVHSCSPHDAQTGPAIRFDQNVIDAQLALLSDEPALQNIYRVLSDSIHEHFNVK
jgi:predicted short-subunit dehydrogenase-like oxidoreductase (DUF2520 family)